MFKWIFGPVLYPKADRLGTYAAALAYSVVLSLVPFLVVTFAVGLQITSQLALKNDVYASSYAQVLRDILPTENPKETARIFLAVQNSTSATKSGFFTVAISFCFAIYTSFNLMDQIFRTVLFIFDDPRRPSAWTWKVMAKTFALLAIWMCLMLMISISAVGATGLRALLDEVHFFTSVSHAFVASLQVAVIVAALFGTFYLTYYLVPTKRYKRRYVMEGSLLASSGWILISLIFASLVPTLLKSSAAYLALGSVVAILLWAQFCAWSIILGACWIVRFSPKPK